MSKIVGLDLVSEDLAHSITSSFLTKYYGYICGGDITKVVDFYSENAEIQVSNLNFSHIDKSEKFDRLNAVSMYLKHGIHQAFIDFSEGEIDVLPVIAGCILITANGSMITKVADEGQGDGMKLEMADYYHQFFLAPMKHGKATAYFIVTENVVIGQKSPVSEEDLSGTKCIETEEYMEEVEEETNEVETQVPMKESKDERKESTEASEKPVVYTKAEDLEKTFISKKPKEENSDKKQDDEDKKDNGNSSRQPKAKIFPKEKPTSYAKAVSEAQLDGASADNAKSRNAIQPVKKPAKPEKPEKPAKRELKEKFQRGKDMSKYICVKGITPSIKKDELIEHFSQFGEVKSLDFVLLGSKFGGGNSKNGQNRGQQTQMCFVEFEAAESASKALEVKEVTLKGLKLTVEQRLERAPKKFSSFNAKGATQNPGSAE